MRMSTSTTIFYEMGNFFIRSILDQEPILYMVVALVLVLLLEVSRIKLP